MLEQGDTRALPPAESAARNALHDDAMNSFMQTLQASSSRDLSSPLITAGDLNQGLKPSPEICMPPLELASHKEVPSKIDKPGNYTETLTVDGITRQYHLHVPPNYDPSKPMPLAVVLHGHGDDSSGVERYSGMDAEADKEGFIVAYPQSIQWFGAKAMAAWDTGNGLVPPGIHADDSGFLRKVMDTCQSRLSVDEKRIYMVGFSNGGMEAYKAATELSDKLAAVVDVSGAMGGGEVKPNSPVSMLSIVGTADYVVPPAGRSREAEAAAAAPDVMRQLTHVIPGLNKMPHASELLQKLALKVGFVPQFKPVEYATEFWKSADGITGPGITRQDGAITTQTFTDPQTGVTVEQEVIAGADHMVQHGTPQGFNLADETWKFLEAHEKAC